MTSDRDNKGRFVHAKARDQFQIMKWMRKNSEPLKIIFAAAAGIFALIEYRSKDYVDHVKNTADVIEAFYKSDEFQSLARIDDMWLSDKFVQEREQLTANKITSSEYRDSVRSEVKQKYREDMVKAIRGLKTISICVIQGRCEYVSACMSVAQEMEDLRGNLRESISDLANDNGACAIDEINFF